MVEHKAHTMRLPVVRDGMEERLALLFDYWCKVRGDRAMPEWSGAGGDGFKLLNVPPRVLPVVTVVDLGEKRDALVYRYWGSERQLFLGGRPDPTGRNITEGLPHFSAMLVLSQYREVQRDGEPILAANTWPLDNGLQAECQTLRLPLGTEDGTVTNVVSATAFLKHAEAFRKFREDSLPREETETLAETPGRHNRKPQNGA